MLNSFAGEKIASCCPISIFSSLLCLVNQGLRSCVAHSVWWRTFFFFPLRKCILQGTSGSDLTALLSLLRGACNPADEGWVHWTVKGSGWVKQNSGIQLLPSRPEPATLTEGSTRILHSALPAACEQCWVRSSRSFSVFFASEFFG